MDSTARTSPEASRIRAPRLKQAKSLVTAGGTTWVSLWDGAGAGVGAAAETGVGALGAGRLGADVGVGAYADVGGGAEGGGKLMVDAVDMVTVALRRGGAEGGPRGITAGTGAGEAAGGL